MLEANGLELWRGERRLFAGLSVSARPGQALHVTGPNGIGKTSLLRVLCGLSTPESGRVCWDGQPLEEDRLEFHAALAFLGHQDGLKGDLTTRENLHFSVSLRARCDDARLNGLLEDAGLSGAAGLYARSLSAGQRRRLALCRVALAGAPLWILDEPLSNLDVAGRDWGHRLIDRHLAGGGIAVVTSHHPLEVAGPVIELALS